MDAPECQEDLGRPTCRSVNQSRLVELLSEISRTMKH